MFLLVPAYPGCPGSKAVKRSLLLLLCGTTRVSQNQKKPSPTHIDEEKEEGFATFLPAANQTMTLMRLTKEHAIVLGGLVAALQISPAQFRCDT